MQCKQCGKWFRQFSIDQIQSKQFSIDQIYCSIECWNRAQCERIKSHLTTKIYLDGEEVKTIKDFDPAVYGYGNRTD